jgi:SAM-dependent methyltransferase
MFGALANRVLSSALGVRLVRLGSLQPGHENFMRELKEWEQLYGDFDTTTDYSNYTVRDLPNVSGFLAGEIIKWAMDATPRRVLLTAENNKVKERLRAVIPCEEMCTAGLDEEVDYRWDFEEDPPHTGQFDLIISQATLNYLIKPYEFIEHLARLLAPGGRLIVHAVHPGRHYKRWPIDALRFYPDWFEEVAHRLGLTVLRKRVRETHLFYMYGK